MHNTGLFSQCKFWATCGLPAKSKKFNILEYFFLFARWSLHSKLFLRPAGISQNNFYAPHQRNSKSNILEFCIFSPFPQKVFEGPFSTELLLQVLEIVQRWRPKISHFFGQFLPNMNTFHTRKCYPLHPGRSRAISLHLEFQVLYGINQFQNQVSLIRNWFKPEGTGFFEYVVW